MTSDLDGTQDSGPTCCASCLQPGHGSWPPYPTGEPPRARLPRRAHDTPIKLGRERAGWLLAGQMWALLSPRPAWGFKGQAFPSLQPRGQPEGGHRSGSEPPGRDAQVCLIWSEGSLTS